MAKTGLDEGAVNGPIGELADAPAAGHQVPEGAGTGEKLVRGAFGEVEGDEVGVGHGGPQGKGDRGSEIGD